jgi:hypothetical protein
MLIIGSGIPGGFWSPRRLFSVNRCWEVISMQKERRSYIERRTGRARRRIFSFKGLYFKRQDRRTALERRSGNEIRENWVRVGRWSSASLNHLKISKYILGKTSLTKNDP